MGQQQLYSTPHAIEILSTNMTSRITMVQAMRPARKTNALLDFNVDNPCLALTPDGIACAATARRGRLSGGFNRDQRILPAPFHRGIIDLLSPFGDPARTCQRTSDR